MSKRSPLPNQQNFDRERRRNLIRMANLSFITSRSVANVRNLLRVIDDRVGENQDCWPSIETIALDLGGVSRSKVFRLIKLAESCHLLLIEHREHESSKYKPNYKLLFDLNSPDITNTQAALLLAKCDQNAVSLVQGGVSVWDGGGVSLTPKPKLNLH